MLNYIEGYARIKNLVKMNFWEISYGSCQESKYLLEFVRDEGFISDEDYGVGYELLKEVGAMLWSDVSRLSKESK
jgi:four helix bundle protein